MTLTRRLLAILSNTNELHLTAQEQRLAWSYLAGVYGEACPYRSKGCKEAHRLGRHEQYDNYGGEARMRCIRRRENLPVEINERHAELLP